MIRARLAPRTDRERIVVAIKTDHDADSELWWETTSGMPPAVPDRLDPVAIALVAKAMNFTQDLHLEGPVSWTLLANLEEFIDAWTIWRPDIFRPISITADEVIDDRFEPAPATATTGVLAFSGGVDGTYAAVAHRSGRLGRRSLGVASAVIIHGFDVPLDDPAGFEIARRGAEAVTAELDIPLVTVRTNWQAVADPEWQMTFGAAIGATLHLFTDRAGAAILAADNTYNHIAIPWGSNAVTGHLLSSRRMRMIQPGAGVTRTQKCQAIGHLPSVQTHLRVCWQGAERGRNCGRCEKCVRTKVNFLAAGHGTIAALGPLEPGQLRHVTIGSTGARGIYEEMRDDVDRLPPDVAADLLWLLEQPLSAPNPAE